MFGRRNKKAEKPDPVEVDILDRMSEKLKDYVPQSDKANFRVEPASQITMGDNGKSVAWSPSSNAIEAKELEKGFKAYQESQSFQSLIDVIDTFWDPSNEMLVPPESHT